MTRLERSAQIWEVLTRDRTICTYGELAEKIGMQRSAAHAMWQFLEPVMRYCDRRRLPPLTVLVVSKATGRPSAGLLTVNVDDAGEVDEAQRRVKEHDWPATTPMLT